MRHLRRDLQRELDDAFEFAVLQPGGLVDEFLLSLLLDRIDILFVRLHDGTDLLPRGLVVAVHQPGANDLFPILGDGPLVHVDDDTKPRQHGISIEPETEEDILLNKKASELGR